MPITFFANTLRVGIIGGGRGSYIKAKTLSSNGVEVEVLSREFIDDFQNISVTLIKKEYYKIIYNKIPELIKIPSINEIIPLNRKRLLWDLDLTLRITMIV